MKVDHIKTMKLYRRGKKQLEIAQELGYSVRQVNRIIKKHKTELDAELNRNAKQGQEDVVWLCMVSCGYSLDEIAQKVGVTRQAVSQKIEPYLANQ